MEKQDFVKHIVCRFGIDFSQAEGMTSIVFDSLQELLKAGQSVNIDELGEFKSTPLFSQGLNHRNNITLARLSKSNMVSFKASKQLTD